jgi:hypothetical protein
MIEKGKEGNASAGKTTQLQGCEVKVGLLGAIG